MTRLLTISLASLTITQAFLACGVGAEEKFEPSADQDEMGEMGEMGEVGQALSSNDHCDTVQANHTVSGDFDAFTTFSSYGTSGCYKGYRLDANNFSGSHSVRPNTTMHWSETECERHRTAVYVWERGASGNTLKGYKWQWGQFNPYDPGETGGASPFPTPECDMSIALHPGDFGMVAGKDYRIAASARRYNQPKDSSSGFSLISLKFE